MSLIKNSTELVIPSTIKMMVYGQAGTGKTTFALSAPKPLLLDFDNGVNRVNNEHLKTAGIVQIHSWDEALQVLNEDLSAFQTVIVDTAGKMLDFIIAKKCGSRQPSIRDWGGINQEFNGFTRSLSMLGKNVIYIAHRDTRSEKDDTIYIPMMRNKNFSAIVTELDLLGYMEMRLENGKVNRTITFDPTERSEGKNACNLPSVMNIPTLIDKSGKITADNDFIMEKVMAPYFTMLQVKRDEQIAYIEVAKQIVEQIELITDAQTANDFIKKIGDFKHVGSSKELARSLLVRKTTQLGLTFNKDTKSYEAA